MEQLKSYNARPPGATTTVRTSAPPGQRAMVSPARKADFFFRGGPITTPGSGNLMKGNPRARKATGKGK
jgi:hypothetical protein